MRTEDEIKDQIERLHEESKAILRDKRSTKEMLIHALRCQQQAKALLWVMEIGELEKTVANKD